MKKLIIVMLILTIPNVTSAECKNPVTKLSKGQVSPCDGFLFTKKKETEVRTKVEEHKITLEQLRIKTEMVGIYKKDTEDLETIHQRQAQKTELWRNAAENSTKSLVKLQSHQKSRDIWNILLGIGLTVGAGIVIQKAGK